MKTTKSRGLKWILQAVGLCFAMTAWGQMDMTGMKMDKSGSQFSQAMDASMKKMDHGMASATMTGDPDHDFAAMMIPHHQGAIDMAQVELKYGKNPELRALCQRIIVAQKKEIAQMKAWLADHPAK